MISKYNACMLCFNYYAVSHTLKKLSQNLVQAFAAIYITTMLWFITPNLSLWMQSIRSMPVKGLTRGGSGATICLFRWLWTRKICVDYSPGFTVMREKFLGVYITLDLTWMTNISSKLKEPCSAISSHPSTHPHHVVPGTKIVLASSITV